MPRDPATPDWFVDTDDKFERFMRDIDGDDWLAVDTEANPMHAYRERVCLIQVSTEFDDFILDPLSDVDLGPFLDKFADPDIAKVFHDVEYDLIQLRRQFGIELRGLVDTRVLAVALGETAVGLASLVERYLGVKLDKRYQRSNWGARPLDAGQIEYARNDTRYLLPLVDKLEAQLDDCDELIHREIDSEIWRLENLEVSEREDVDPEGFLKLKGATALSPEEQRVLRELWNWREKESERRDLPPFKVIGNAQLMAISSAIPGSRGELARVQGMPPSIAQRHGAAIQSVIEKAREMPPYKIERSARKPGAGYTREDRQGARPTQALAQGASRQAAHRPFAHPQSRSHGGARPRLAQAGHPR
jgi:ribonuclease D